MRSTKLILTIIICSFLCNLFYAASREEDQISLTFTPAREEFVNELPETVKDFPLSSTLPVVFRGAAKNWQAMNWTPQSLAEMGFPGIQWAFNHPEASSREVNVSELAIKQDGKRVYISNKKLTELLEQDTNFTENFLYRSPYNNLGQKFSYALLGGAAGASQIGFDLHEAAYLAEFYGEKLVFLASPALLFNHQLSEYENWINDTVKENMKKGMTKTEALMTMLENEKWDELLKISEIHSPLQRTILKPGDILYIPASWGHFVFYLQPSIGVTQQVMFDNVNTSEE